MYGAQKKNVRKKNALSASASLVGLKSWIKTGTAWSIAQTSADGLRNMRA